MSKQIDKDQVLQAILECGSFTAASKATGVSRRTIYTYLHEDRSFAEGYEAARNAQILERAESLADKRQEAMKTVYAIMTTAENAYERLQAARLILDMATKADEKAEAVTAANVRFNQPDSILDRALGNTLFL